MLGSELVSTRLAAIYSLRRLAEGYPEQFHLQVVELLCAFVRHPPPFESPHQSLREDVRPALDFLVSRSSTNGTLEKRPDFLFNLRKANLAWACVAPVTANFDHFDLTQTDLSDAKLWRASFRDAKMPSANLQRADLTGSDLQEADLRRANLARLPQLSAKTLVSD